MKKYLISFLLLTAIGFVGWLIFSVNQSQSIKNSFGAFAPISIPAGGTKATSFSPNSIIVSGNTSTSSLSATTSNPLTIGYINATNTATSTYSGGISIDSGCYALSDGTCTTSASTTSTLDGVGATNRLTFWNGLTSLSFAYLLGWDVSNLYVGSSTPPAGIAAFEVGQDGTLQGLVARVSGGATNLFPTDGAGLELAYDDDDLTVSGVALQPGNAVLQAYSRARGNWSDMWFKALGMMWTVNDINAMVLTRTGRLGIGTTTPGSLLSVHGNGLISGTLSSANLIATGTLDVTGLSTLTGGFISSASSTVSANFFANNIGLSSTTPYARLSIKGVTGSLTRLFAVASSTDSDVFTIHSSGTTTIDQLQTGTLTFAPNAGISTLIDFGVDSGAANNTVEAYNLSIDASSTLTVWSRSDGSGGIKDQRIGLSTSTPSAELAIGAGPATTTIYLDSTGTKGSCIQMKSPNQTSYAVYVGNDGVLTATAGNCK